MARRRRSEAAGGGTRATVALRALGVSFEIHPYEVSAHAEEATVGEAAAAALDVPASQVFKTLIADVDARPTCAIVPTSRTLSLKALAAAAGGKRAKMVDSASAERLTGYVTGGISPFGQLRALPMFVDASALGFERIFVSAGQRGLQMSVAPRDLIERVSATIVEGLGAS